MTYAVRSENGVTPHRVSSTEKRQGSVSQNVLGLLQTERFLKNDIPTNVQIVKEFRALGAQDVPKVIESFVNYISDKLHLLDPVAIVDRLAHMVTSEKVSLAYSVRQEPAEIAVQSALRSAKTMYGAALHFLKVTENKSAVSLHSYYKSCLESLVSLAETLLSVYGIGDLFKPSDNDYKNDMKLQKVMTLINSFSLFTVSLQPILGPAVTSLVVGGSLLFIAALSVVYPFVKPASATIPFGQNVIRQIEKGQIKAVEGRKNILDKIAGLLSAGSHVLLIGESRVGKTLIVRALAAAILRGDYPGLAGKYLHLIKTPELVTDGRNFNSYGEISTGLSKISQGIHSARTRHILAFDEIHVACQAEKHKALAEHFKSLLDVDEPDNFPLVIGITTKAEYEAYVRPNAAFKNRFTLINVDSTDESETLQIECNTLLTKGSKTFLENGAFTLKYLYDQINAHFKNPVQPHTTLGLLKRCIEKTSENQESKLAEEVSGIRGQIASLEAQAAVSSVSLHPNFQKEVLEKDLANKSARLAEQKVALQAAFDARTKLFMMKSALMKTICRLAICNSENISAEGRVDLNRFLLLRECSEKLQAKLALQAKALKIHLCIDEALIDKTIREELVSQKEVKNALGASRRKKIAATASI